MFAYRTRAIAVLRAAVRVAVQTRARVRAIGRRAAVRRGLCLGPGPRVDIAAAAVAAAAGMKTILPETGRLSVVNVNVNVSVNAVVLLLLPAVAAAVAVAVAVRGLALALARRHLLLPGKVH